jgi:hypothetical protein
MFRTTSCSSSGESIVLVQYLVCVTLCSEFLSSPFPICVLDGHLRRVTYQILYWYNWFSWWWARGCSKHLENWNKQIEKKNCASSWLFTRTLSVVDMLRWCTHWLFTKIWVIWGFRREVTENCVLLLLRSECVY